MTDADPPKRLTPFANLSVEQKNARYAKYDADRRRHLKFSDNI